MSAFLRIAGGFGLTLLVANALFAAKDASPAQGMESSVLPSATAKSSVDDGVQMASNEEPAGGVTCCGPCDGNIYPPGQMGCCYEPMWEVTAGAVFLNRSRPNPGGILTPIGAPGIISNAGDFGFGWNAGPDVTVARQMANGLGWDVRYFNALNSTATADYPGVTGARVFGTNILGITSLSASDVSNLDSGEINLSAKENDVCTFLAGFRWIELQDQLTYTYNHGVLTTAFNDMNRLYGGQAGVDLALLNCGGPLRIDAAFKAGAYSNGAENSFRANAIFASHSESSSQAAFVGDIDVAASYQLSKHLALRGGYQLLWIDELALATNNAVNAAATGSTAAGIKTNGSVFYQGATAAMEFTW